MTDASIKQKALTAANALLGAGHITLGQLTHQELMLALVHVVEQSEAFKQEVSGTVHAFVYESGTTDAWEKLNSFIIPKPQPDPLVEVLDALKDGRAAPTTESYAAFLRAALEARGWEIREKGQ